MSIHNNFPTISWIKLDGISVTQGDKTYIVQDFKTNLKYVYWNSDTPNTFSASNVMLSKTATRFLVVINNKGECIISPNQDIVVSFDGNSVDSITEHIWGLHQKDEEYGNKFVSVEQNIDGLTTTVGQHKEEIDKAHENISKIEQRADGIDLSVKNLTTEYTNNKEMLELREQVNMSIIDVNSSLGIFKSTVTSTFKDNKIETDEKTELEANITILQERKDKVVEMVDKVIALVGNEGNQTEINKVNAQKQAFINAIDNIITLVNTAISDNIIVPTEITIVTTAFGNANVQINTLKNEIDTIFLLGTGGTVSEELARIGIKSDEIELSVQKNEDGLTQAQSSINILNNQIALKVEEGEVKSIIQQNPDSVMIGFNGISNNIVMDANGLTVNQGAIACDILTTPAGHHPIIRLFPNGTEYCSIDATRQYEQGRGDAIRLKWNSDNYLLVRENQIDMFTGAIQSFAFYGNNTSSTIGGKGGTLVLGSELFYNSKAVEYKDHSHTTIQALSQPTSYYVSAYCDGTSGDATLSAGGARVSVSNYTSWQFSPNSNNSTDLGDDSKRWRTIYSNNSLNTSDVRFKENILYLNDTLPHSDSQIRTTFLDFIKEDLKVATYNYKAKNEDGTTPNANFQLGFIANDIYETEVGKYFIYDFKEEGLMFSPTGYTTVVAKALQEESTQRENEISELKLENENLKNEIKELNIKLNSLIDLISTININQKGE